MLCESERERPPNIRIQMRDSDGSSNSQGQLCGNDADHQRKYYPSKTFATPLVFLRFFSNSHILRWWCPISPVKGLFDGSNYTVTTILTFQRASDRTHWTTSPRDMTIREKRVGSQTWRTFVVGSTPKALSKGRLASSRRVETQHNLSAPTNHIDHVQNWPPGLVARDSRTVTKS